MATRKHALLLFSKPPVPGLVKTRLTKEFGGPLSPEQAAELFKRSIFDVAELCMFAMYDLEVENLAQREADPSTDEMVYDFFVSTTPASNVELIKATFDEIGPWPREIHYISDHGATFDDHFDDAFAQIFAQGYETIVSVGGDIPTMPKTHIVQAFQWLHYFQDQGTPGFVQAPCQECGTSMVGWCYNTAMDNQSIYYNMDGVPALDGYMKKLKAADPEIPSAFFSPVADIDEGSDLAHAMSCLRAIAEAAKHQPELYVARRVLAWIDFYGFTSVAPPNDNHDPRQYIDE